ncbi:MAG: SDR family oxidoreductase [Alcaligenaceae bacterium]
MNLDLAVQVVCVTGGSEGIGLATAQAFAQEGAHVVICGRRQTKLDEAVASHAVGNGGSIEAVQADMTKLAEIDKLIAYLQTRFGRLDILVNNAGTGIYKPFANVTDDELQDGMAINFFAQFRVSQRALPLLKKSSFPSIINISGRTAVRGNFPPGSSCTGPAKAAEVRFSVDLATELAEFGIRVNCVIPGVVKSEERLRLWESQASGGQWQGDTAIAKRDKLETVSVPKGQTWGVPIDIANIVVFLASPRASYVNGAALTVDGGPHTKSYVSQLYVEK